MVMRMSRASATAGTRSAHTGRTRPKNTAQPSAPFFRPRQRSGNTPHGVADTSSVSPDGYSLDNFYLARPDADEVQLDLFGDYKTNVALYPEFQAYFRKHKPPFLAAWGKNDPFFLPQGAEAFKRDIPDAEVRFFDTGHFALETHCDEIAAAIRNFLSRSK